MPVELNTNQHGKMHLLKYKSQGYCYTKFHFYAKIYLCIIVNYEFISEFISYTYLAK